MRRCTSFLLRFEQNLSYEDVLNLIIEVLEDKVIPRSKYIDLMIYISITFKGLTVMEIFALTGITQEDWNLMLAFFKLFFNTYKGLWTVSNDLFKKAIENRYLKNANREDKMTLDGRPLKNTYHLNIGKQMEKVPNSIRKLEEQTINYFFAREYHELKQTISDIENFLILFNPYTKYDLCRYWQWLEGEGYDPVIEYNKRLEIFDIHFEPKPEDLFIIILQISRFFKEFADFETRKTPDFKHPFIRGKLMQLKEGEEKEEHSEFRADIIGFLNQDGKLNNTVQKEQFMPGTTEWVFRQNDEEEDWLEHQLAIKDAQIDFSTPDNLVNYLQDIGLAGELKKMGMGEEITVKVPRMEGNIEEEATMIEKTIKAAPLKGHELLNTNIPHAKVRISLRSNDSLSILREKSPKK